MHAQAGPLKKRERDRNTSEEIRDEVFPKFNRNSKPADPRCSTNLKRKMTPGYLTIKPLKTRDKGKIFKSHQMQRNVTHRKMVADELLEAVPDRRQRTSLKRERA